MDLIAGMEMDLQPRRYKTFDDLYLYCYRVASVVGLMSIEIFGYGNPATRQYAVDMGLALQITNILRDLKPDAALGRIYLPQEDLERFGYTEQDLLANRYTPAFVQLMRFQAQRARGYYEAAARSLPPEDRRALSAARAMGATYRRLLEKIEKADYRVFDGRISLSKTRKVWIAAKTWLGGII
jgi:phytoene synthase